MFNLKSKLFYFGPIFFLINILNCLDLCTENNIEKYFTDCIDGFQDCKYIKN